MRTSPSFRSFRTIAARRSLGHLWTLLALLPGCATILGADFDRPGTDPNAIARDGGGRDGRTSPDASGEEPGGEPSGTTSFALEVDGNRIPPADCFRRHWAFPLPPGLDSGVHSFVLRNTGTRRIAYLAREWWNGSDPYLPGEPTAGIATGGPELSGVLEQGQTADLAPVVHALLADIAISPAYGALLAEVAGLDPFSPGTLATDEGTIEWPPGHLGWSAAKVNVAQLSIFPPTAPCASSGLNPLR